MQQIIAAAQEKNEKKRAEKFLKFQNDLLNKHGIMPNKSAPVITFPDV